jgi:predicted signal transduction protein with EAL and GGDEF domain
MLTVGSAAKPRGIDTNDVQGEQPHFSARVGVALFPQDSTEFDSLMTLADTALYHPKQSGQAR